MTPAHGVAVAANELGQRMHDNVGAVLDRSHQVGAGHRVVDDQRQPMPMGNLGDGRDIDEGAAGIGQALDENAAGAIVDLAFDLVEIGRIGPAHLPVEILEGVAELVDRAAIQLVGGNEVVARLHDGMEHQQLRAVTGNWWQVRRSPLRGRQCALPAPPGSGS